MSKYFVSWSEDSFVKSWSSRSFIKTFAMVYGVNEFIIKTKKFSIYGTRFIAPEKRYDVEFYRLVNCFLSRKNVIKLYKYLTKNSFSLNKGEIRKAVKYQSILESSVRPNNSFNEMIQESFNPFGECPKNAKQ